MNRGQLPDRPLYGQSTEPTSMWRMALSVLVLIIFCIFSVLGISAMQDLINDETHHERVLTARWMGDAGLTIKILRCDDQAPAEQEWILCWVTAEEGPEIDLRCPRPWSEALACQRWINTPMD